MDDPKWIVSRGYDGTAKRDAGGHEGAPEKHEEAALGLTRGLVRLEDHQPGWGSLFAAEVIPDDPVADRLFLVKRRGTRSAGDGLSRNTAASLTAWARPRWAA